MENRKSWKESNLSQLQLHNRPQFHRVLPFLLIYTVVPNQHPPSESNSISPPQLQTVRFLLPAIRCVPNFSNETNKSQKKKKKKIMIMMIMNNNNKKWSKTKQLTLTWWMKPTFPAITSSPAGIRRFSSRRETAWKNSPFPRATTKRCGNKRSVPAEWRVPKSSPRGPCRPFPVGTFGDINRRWSQNICLGVPKARDEPTGHGPQRTSIERPGSGNGGIDET